MYNPLLEKELTEMGYRICHPYWAEEGWQEILDVDSLDLSDELKSYVKGILENSYVEATNNGSHFLLSLYKVN